MKAETFAKAQPMLKDGAIFASNTSTLPINSLAEEWKDQSKFIGIHFFSPVEKMMLVEIIVGKNTGDVALATALDYVRQIRKTPIVVNDSRGFFANRCVLRFTAEGLEMLKEGVPPAMIENTARMAGMPVGPLSLSDEVALDLVLKIMKATEADLGPNAIDQEQKKLLVEMVEKQGRFGRKNGKGFYDYPEKGKGKKALWPGTAALQPKQLDPDELDVEELKQRFLVVQAVEAARTVEDHVITDPREADVGSILGFGFAPYTGGTLSYIDFMGAKNFVALCHKLEAKYGSRFTPPKLLEEMAAKGETFYGRFAPKKAAAGLQEWASCAGLDPPSRFLDAWICGVTGQARHDLAGALRRLDQAFREHRFLHLRPLADAVEIGLQVRVLREVELQPDRPAQHREQIAVGDRELAAHQVVLPGEPAVDVAQGLAELVAEDRLSLRPAWPGGTAG